MDVRKLKFDNRKLLAAFVTLACVCVAISTLSFKIKWGVWPDLSDILMSLTLLAPFAVPKAFADTVGITNPHSTSGVLFMAVVYWPVALSLLWYTFRSRLVTVFALLAVISLIASFNWQIVATGMMGI